MERRRFIKIASVGAAGLTLPIRHIGAMEEHAAVLRPGSMITSNQDFYVLQKGNPPKLKTEHWRLGVMGLVEKRKIFSYAEIAGMTSVTTMRTLKCIGDPIGTEQMSNAMWTGVPLHIFLNKSGVKSDAKLVVFRCADGYHTAIPIADAMREQTLLAYKMNGVLLPSEHGFPVRLLNPGHYGTKNPKWIVTIELATEHEGFWERRGWDSVANVKLATMIGVPGENATIKAGTAYTISGAAFDSGNHAGIKSVEVSIDAGATWEKAELWASDSPLAWTLWKYAWQVPEKAKPVEICARAIAHDGLIQKETGFDADLAGAISYHTINAAVAE